MSWCGRCFTAQTTSDFESEDDGEYEYFANSRYICKRKKTIESSNRAPTIVEANSSMSRTGESETSSLQSCSTTRTNSIVKSGCSQKEEGPSDTLDKNSSVASQLKDGRVWQVAHTTVENSSELRNQPFFNTSTSDSDQTLEIVFDAPRREAKTPSQGTNSPDYVSQVCRGSSLTTTATSMTTIDHSCITIPKKRPGFIRRLLGISGKPNSFPEYGVSRVHSSLFKETMELPSPAETTKTLFWTVRVKLKQ